jgi:hypothetical protein
MACATGRTKKEVVLGRQDACLSSDKRGHPRAPGGLGGRCTTTVRKKHLKGQGYKDTRAWLHSITFWWDLPAGSRTPPRALRPSSLAQAGKHQRRPSSFLGVPVRHKGGGGDVRE